MIELDCTIDVPAPADVVWGILSDYRRDPEWRIAVSVMEPSPAGPSMVGTTTHEVMRLGGRTYVNDGVVDDVVPGRRIEWHTTEGADASGAREVVPTPDGRSRVTLELRIRPHGAESLFAPIVRRTVRKQLWQDLEDLCRLVLEEHTRDQGSAQEPAISLGAYGAPMRSK